MRSTYFILDCLINRNKLTKHETFFLDFHFIYRKDDLTFVMAFLQNDTTYIGAIVGRVANRIGGAQFTLNGTHYKLVANEGKNMLHGMY